MKKLFKNAFVIAAGGVAAKILGALYRVPLTNILGADGMGVYQLVFPFYTLLLTISATGIPNGIARLTAERSVGALKKSLILFGTIGAAMSLLMFFSAETIAAFYGDIRVAAAYKAMSPSVAIVSVVSCLRGYWQGKLNMVPTAASQIVEQAFKMLFGLILCTYFGSDAAEKAAFAALAVTVSEFAALIYLLSVKRKKEVYTDDISIKEVFKAVAPITLSAIAIPLSRAADGFFLVNLAGGGAEATATLGIYGGVVEAIIALPVSVCYALSVSGIPLIAGAKKNAADNSAKVIIYTLIFSSVFALGLFLFSERIVGVMYPRLSREERALAAGLMKVSSASVVGLSVVQAFAAVEVAKGRLFVSPICLGVGVTAKMVAAAILVQKAEIGVYGCAFSDIICYFVATICFLLYIIRDKKISCKDDTDDAIDGYRAWRGKRRRFGQRA